MIKIWRRAAAPPDAAAEKEYQTGAVESLTMWHSAGWWKPKFQGTEDLRIWEMDRFRRAWDDWPGTDNPYQGRDRTAPREIIGIVPVSFPVHSLCFKVYFYRI